MLTLLASGVRAISGSAVVTPPVQHPELLRSARFVLTVSAAATENTDTLDVYVQQAYDGTNYDDVAHFTQVLGNGGAKTFIAEWFRAVTPESELHAPADAGLAAGVLQGGKLAFPLRLKWVVVDAGGAAASFTFGVQGEFEYARR